MADKTAAQRIKRQRDHRLREGWQEVRVWVPTDQDAADVRQLAAERRALAEAALQGDNKKVTEMEIQEEINAAIAAQGSPEYITPSGPTLTLMSKLARQGDLEGFAQTFTTFARVRPANARFVENAAPAKILNGYFIEHLKLDAQTFLRWERENRDWGKWIIAALREPSRFVAVVSAMAEGIRQARHAH